MDGRYSKLLASLSRIDLLVLDDWGLHPLTEGQRRDLLEILEDRYGCPDQTAAAAPGAGCILPAPRTPTP